MITALPLPGWRGRCAHSSAMTFRPVVAAGPMAGGVPSVWKMTFL
jgi:hypothetical protein